ncbi:MAG: FKBP-type peptidyl-prolyl cis-trans isomerase [Acidobacteriota bacterium]|nr:FKBP-type peptidyl-prolyl cis-trans isomerase [Acidobacteriota bacterium]
MVRSKSILAVVMAVAVFGPATAGCNDSPTSPNNNAAFSQTDLRLGTGADAVAGKTIKVNYTGWLYNSAQPDQKGTQFDSSAGLAPLTFVLGGGQVIAGWDQGLEGMKVGGIRRLVIPPSLGYGSRRNGPIPPNATLVFEIELLEVVTPGP